MTNKNNTVLYTGVTADLRNHVYAHRNKLNPNCFTAKYDVSKLVYYKWFSSILEAIAEDKRIKVVAECKKLT